MEYRKIPWYGLGAIYEQDDIDAVMDILRPNVSEAKGFFRLPEEPEFQRAFAEHEGSAYASAVSSCGTGLDLALQAFGIGPGDEVVTTPLTFVATGSCVLLKGARVVFADIDPTTLNLDPRKVEERITPRTKAVLPVHFTGLPVDLDEFDRIGKKHSVKVVHDAAHAAGARYKGRGIGGFGDMTVYSFQSNKNMSTLGEGGAVTTDCEESFTRLERMKSFGFRYGPVDEVVEVGSNYRMTKVQSAVGLTQLRKIDRNNALRRKWTRYLTEALAGTDGIQTPYEPEGYESACHLYAILLDDEKTGITRDGFIRRLKDRYGIDTKVLYPPVYDLKVFKDLGYSGEDTPVAAKVARQLFEVPVFARMQEDDFAYLAWAVKDALRSL